MREIITHAPIQTRSDTLHKQERMSSLLASEAIIRIKEYATGKAYPRIDLWNTIGAKAETDYQKNCQPDETRNTFVQFQINERYRLLGSFYDISPNGRVSIRDDSSDYQDFVLSQIKRFLDMGIFVVSSGSFLRCDLCDYVFAPSQAAIAACPQCKDSNLVPTQKTGLFMPISTQQRSEAASSVKVYPQKTGLCELKRHLFTLPDNIQISKQREFGVCLADFGVDPEFVLDPKISLAMMGLFLRHGYGDLHTVIQGIDSLGNLAPYLAIIDNKPPEFVVHGTLPPIDSSKINPAKASFYFPFLVLTALALPNGISQEKLKCLSVEFQRTINQARYAISHINGLPSDNQEQTNTPFPKEVLENFLNYHPQLGYQQLHCYIYEQLSHNPNSSLLRDIRQMVELFYGKI